MSTAGLMHPRNVFRVPPDYTQLAVKYADFRKVCRLGINGKVNIDLKQSEVLKQLTKALLEEYFNLKMTLPPDCLIPTVPLRLNYILWLEDIMEAYNAKDITGIDIGCGASCIYCLITAKKNNWQMIGLESKDENLKFAKQNVQDNNLQHKITLVTQKDKNIIFGDFFKSISEETNFDFCLCNPPFYDKEKIQNFSNRTATRKAPKNAPTGTEEELSCEGGELTFIQGIIEDSLMYKTRIRVYTTMIGSKVDTIEVLNTLKTKKINNFTWTEFCQGNVTRWGVAWSLDSCLNLDKVPAIRRSLIKF